MSRELGPLGRAALVACCVTSFPVMGDRARAGTPRAEYPIVYRTVVLKAGGETDFLRNVAQFAETNEFALWVGHPRPDSEAVANYLGSAQSLAFHGSYPSETRAGLRVYVATPDYLLAMKLRALRPGTRDEADAVTLARACRLTGVDELVGLVQKFFPKEKLDARRRAIVAQFANGLSDAPGPDIAG